MRKKEHYLPGCAFGTIALSEGDAPGSAAELDQPVYAAWADHHFAIKDAFFKLPKKGKLYILSRALLICFAPAQLEGPAEHRRIYLAAIYLKKKQV